VAYDEAVAQRVRDHLTGIGGVTERRMMGGLCFMVDGNMLAGVNRNKSGQDRFMFRVGKENETEALRRPGASIVDMGGKRMGGFVFVEADACDRPDLNEWVGMALGYVGQLPKK